MARTGIRASGIAIHNNKILLIHRKKDGFIYWVFPGGGIEENEDPKATVVREIKEETNLTAKNPKFVFMDRHNGKDNPFFIVDLDYREPEMVGVESERDPNIDWYQPKWVDFKKIKEINLLPENAKIELQKIIKI